MLVQRKHVYYRDTFDEPGGYHYGALVWSSFLAPLYLLRSLKVLEFTQSSALESLVPAHFRSSRIKYSKYTSRTSQLPDKHLLDVVTDLVKGDNPTEPAFKMYDNLLEYAQIFERGEAHMVYVPSRGFSRFPTAFVHPRVENAMLAAWCATYLEDSEHFKS